jgi:uncharacterized hydrophobic protein (TIGR00271 family)
MTALKAKTHRALVAIGEESHVAPLMAAARFLTAGRQSAIIILSVTADGQRPAWLRDQSSCQECTVTVQVIKGANPAEALLAAIGKSPPDLLLLGWEGDAGQGRFLLGSTLDPIIRAAPCPVFVLRLPKTDSQYALFLRNIGDLSARHHLLIPTAGGPNALLALDMASWLPNSEVTALYVTSRKGGFAELEFGHAQLKSVISALQKAEQIKPQVIQADSVITAILEEARHYNLVVLGASEENLIERALFGNVPQRIAMESETPTLVVRRGFSHTRSLARRLRWQLFESLPKLDIQERAAVYRDIWHSTRPRTDFFVMMILSAVIATLGLLLNSAAVIIGAMLVAPLMSAIIAIGLGVIQGNLTMIRVAARAIIRGAFLAVLVGFLVAILASSRAPTTEILSRAHPSLLDLAVALVSGAACAYALCRKDVSASLPGVAIAAALVPPLTTVGIGLALGSLAIAGGAALLFLTNLTAISIAGALIFLWLGFGPASDQDGRVRVFQGGIALTVALFVVTLCLLLASTALSWSRSAELRALQTVLDSENSVLQKAEIVDWRVRDSRKESLSLELVLRTEGDFAEEDARSLQARISARVRRPVDLTIEMVPIKRLAPPD